MICQTYFVGLGTLHSLLRVEPKQSTFFVPSGKSDVICVNYQDSRRGIRACMYA